MLVVGTGELLHQDRLVWLHELELPLECRYAVCREGVDSLQLALADYQRGLLLLETHLYFLDHVEGSGQFVLPEVVAGELQLQVRLGCQRQKELFLALLYLVCQNIV